jgi:hypothetical protein
MSKCDECGDDESKCTCEKCKECGSVNDIEDDGMCYSCLVEYHDHLDTVKSND